MTTERIKEIQAETAYPNSVSVQQALLKVWNECQQEQLHIQDMARGKQLVAFCRWYNQAIPSYETTEEEIVETYLRERN